MFAIVARPASFAFAQAEKDGREQPIQLLKRGAMFYGYPGTMAFHTAFHAGTTSRYLLLKATSQLPEFRDYLVLTVIQIEAIAKLQPLDIDAIRTDNPKAVTDPNAELDEQIANPDYFAFLSSDQINKLDRVTFAFDGFASLSRRSLIKRLKISQTTDAKISAILLKNRENIFLPYFRWRFAAPLPPDHEFQDCDFSGKFITHLNYEIVDALSLTEAQALISWFATHSPPDTLIEKIKRLAPLPTGLFGLDANSNGEQGDKQER